MSGRGFKLHPLAAKDIIAIWEYIAQDNLTAAARVRQEIEDAIRGLVEFPMKGHKRADITSQPVRFWRVHQYLIAYAPERQPLWVIAVMHGRRNPRFITATLRDRKEM